MACFSEAVNPFRWATNLNEFQRTRYDAQTFHWERRGVRRGGVRRGGV
jgi:hypothetical protein